MSTSSTPSKAKDKERIIKLLHESILHLCKVSVSGPGNIEVDGIVCITQPNESDIVVKVHETFSNVHSEKEGTEKRKHSTDGEGSHKTPRKDSSERGDRQHTPVSRRLISDGETLDLTKDDADASMSRLHRSPHRNRKTDIIDLTSGNATPAPQLNITQVRSLQQQRFGQTQRYQRFVSVRGRGGYQMVPRQRFMAQGQVMPGMRQMAAQGAVRPISGPIPHRGYRPQGGAMMTPRVPMPGSTATMTTSTPGGMLATNGNRLPFDVHVQGYKGLHCKYKDCSFACSNKYYLETHVLQHFESDPFSCNEEGCEFKSKNKQNLYQHYKSTHSAANPQFCFKCMKAFKSPDELAAHTQTCTVESIKCDHCGEMIMGKVAMAKHLTEVYIAESSKMVDQGVSDQSQSHTSSSGTSQSPATTPSPGQTSAQSPVAASPQQRPPESPRNTQQSIPDMSSPLNIIPDNSPSISQPTNPATTLVQPELEQLQQLAGTPSSQVETTEGAVSSPASLPSLDYHPPTSNAIQYMNQEQQEQQRTQPMDEAAMSPSLNIEPSVHYQQQERHYPNLELLNQPMPMDQPHLDPIQMPSLGDTMSLPEPDQIDTKPPDFNT